MRNSRLVYSTEKGRVCSKCGKASAKCGCRKKSAASRSLDPGDGVIRIRRETKGRKGKGVTTLSGFQLDNGELKELAAKLKRICGTGGSVKDGIILIQGDQREAIQVQLQKMGFRVKLAGG